MKIVGVGVDLVEVKRFKDSVKRGGERFLNRLFTPSELAYAKARKAAMQHLAARFAAKEAIVKALGVPKGLGLKWQDLKITHDPDGKPVAELTGTLERWSGFEIHLSLTHTDQHAMATATAVHG